jgi:hypothetical protein
LEEWPQGSRTAFFVHPITRSPDHPINPSPYLPILFTLSPDSGFTLFEVLISISLTGFVMLALLIGLRVANRAWRTGEARLRQVHAEAERNSFVVEQISSLVPYKVTSQDPHLVATLIVLQANAACLRFVTSYSSVFRSHSGLVLAEYGIVESQRGNLEVALRESQVGDSDTLFHRLVSSVTTDPETAVTVINYQPFVLRPSDMLLMAGLSDARFEYLDPHPDKDGRPVWRESWRSTDTAPYPAAIRLRWVRGSQEGEQIIPVRAKPLPPSPFGQ